MAWLCVWGITKWIKEDHHWHSSACPLPWSDPHPNYYPCSCTTFCSPLPLSMQVLELKSSRWHFSADDIWRDFFLLSIRIVHSQYSGNIYFQFISSMTLYMEFCCTTDTENPWNTRNSWVLHFLGYWVIITLNRSFSFEHMMRIWKDLHLDPYDIRIHYRRSNTVEVPENDNG